MSSLDWMNQISRMLDVFASVIMSMIFKDTFLFLKNHTAYSRDIPHCQGLYRHCKCDGSCLPKCHPEQLHKAY